MAFSALRLLQVPGQGNANWTADADADAIIFHQVTSPGALRNVFNRDSDDGEPEAKKARTKRYELFVAGDHAIAVREPWTVEATTLHNTDLEGWFVLQATLAHATTTPVNVFACHFVSKGATPDPDVRPHKTALGRALWKKRRNAKAAALRSLLDKVITKDMSNALVIDCEHTPTSNTFEIALAPRGPVAPPLGRTVSATTFEESVNDVLNDDGNGERDTRDPILVSFSSDKSTGGSLAGASFDRDGRPTWSSDEDANEDMHAT